MHTVTEFVLDLIYEMYAIYRIEFPHGHLMFIVGLSLSLTFYAEEGSQKFKLKILYK